jgi:broad specificity phosphatase PhoE
MLFAASSSSSNQNEVVFEPTGSLFAASLPDLAPNKRRIYLLRHGETDWNKQGLMQGGGYDIPLNDNGLRQAQSVAQVLSSLPIGLIASSHLARAHETADILHAKHPGADRVVLNGLGEMRFGEFEGLAIHGELATEETKESFLKFNTQMQNDPQLPWPGDCGECTLDVEKRARQAVQDILLNTATATDTHTHIAIVAHGRTNKILLASLLYNNVAKMGPIKQGNTCINVVDFEASSNTFESVVINYVDHAADVPERHR